MHLRSLGRGLQRSRRTEASAARGRCHPRFPRRAPRDAEHRQRAADAAVLLPCGSGHRAELAMSLDVVCLRPEADFARVDELPSPRLRVAYMKPDDDAVPARLGQARALVIPAVGSKLPASLFADAPLALVQVTGAGVDRLDAEALKARGIPVANVPGGSNNAVAE